MKMIPVVAATGLSVFVAIGAPAAPVDDFVAGCLESLNWNRAMCECAANKAQAELTPQGLEFHIASFRKDDEQTARLRSSMGPQEVVSTATFMPRAAKACASSR